MTLIIGIVLVVRKATINFLVGAGGEAGQPDKAVKRRDSDDGNSGIGPGSDMGFEARTPPHPQHYIDTRLVYINS